MIYNLSGLGATDINALLQSAASAYAVTHPQKPAAQVTYVQNPTGPNQAYASDYKMSTGTKVVLGLAAAGAFYVVTKVVMRRTRRNPKGRHSRRRSHRRSRR